MCAVRAQEGRILFAQEGKALYLGSAGHHAFEALHTPLGHKLTQRARPNATGRV